MKCDLCMALGTGTARDGVKQFPSPPPSPFAPRMHEIKQNDSTHPTINDGHLDTRVQCAKNHNFGFYFFVLM